MSTSNQRFCAQIRRPVLPKPRDEVLLDRLHAIRIAAKAVVKWGRQPEFAQLERELDAFDRADVETRAGRPLGYGVEVRD